MQTEFSAPDNTANNSVSDGSSLAWTIGVTVASFVEVGVAKICLPSVVARLSTMDTIHLAMGTILAIGLGLLAGKVAGKRLSSPPAHHQPIAASIVLPKAAGESATLMPH